MVQGAGILDATKSVRVRRRRRMEFGVWFFITVFATIVGVDRGRFIAAANYDDSGLSSGIAEDVLLVTKPLVKMYEMGVMKEDKMSEVISNQPKEGHFNEKLRIS